VGYTLDEIENDITESTPASFEPSIDYVVTKIPRFTFEKFPETEALLTTSMRSVGEAMAIGRTFKESLQKALRSLETGLTGLDEVDAAACPRPTARATRSWRRSAGRRRTGSGSWPRPTARGWTTADVRRATAYDPWFLRQSRSSCRTEEEVRASGLPDDAPSLLALKADGFSDARLAKLAGLPESSVRERRAALGVRPVYKRIDTCAAEFEAQTPYMYACYETAPWARSRRTRRGPPTAAR
jgi:carbamoyl-phosphate synthase large subunit